MRQAMELLAAGDPLRFDATCVGRPTKQRLNKYGLAVYSVPQDSWDGPMELTDKGRRFLAKKVGQ
jgi:uroporphyrinogen-III synthase